MLSSRRRPGGITLLFKREWPPKQRWEINEGTDGVQDKERRRSEFLLGRKKDKVKSPLHKEVHSCESLLGRGVGLERLSCCHFSL